MREPIVFLFDEPLSNLDAQLRVQMRTEIRALHQRLQTTMIYVTHDQVEAMTLADRIVVMRDGHIEQTGAPDQVYDRSRPENRVTLSDSVVDSSGLPAPRIAYGMCENDARLARFGIERAVELAGAMGAWDIKVNPFRDARGVYAPPAWHLLGTARMGRRPRKLRRHQVAPGLGLPQPLHHRRVRHGDRRRHQPDQHH